MTVSHECFYEKPYRIQYSDFKVACIKDQWVNMVTTAVTKAELDWAQETDTGRLRFFSLLLPGPIWMGRAT